MKKENSVSMSLAVLAFVVIPSLITVQAYGLEVVSKEPQIMLIATTMIDGQTEKLVPNKKMHLQFSLPRHELRGPIRENLDKSYLRINAYSPDGVQILLRQSDNPGSTLTRPEVTWGEFDTQVEPHLAGRVGAEWRNYYSNRMSMPTGITLKLVLKNTLLQFPPCLPVPFPTLMGTIVMIASEFKLSGTIEIPGLGSFSPPSSKTFADFVSVKECVEFRRAVR